MKVYITYDRYEHDEWFYVYYLGRNYDKAYAHCVEVDLPDFISYGPDDCHSFQLKELEMSEYMYRKLRKFVNAKKLSREEQNAFDDLMIKIHDGYFEEETLLSTDGCSDNSELIEFYCQSVGIEADDYDAIDEAEKKLFNDEELYTKTLKEYIAIYY